MLCGWCGKNVRPSRMRGHLARELPGIIMDGGLWLDGRRATPSDPWHMMDRPICVTRGLLERVLVALQEGK